MVAEAVRAHVPLLASHQPAHFVEAPVEIHTRTGLMAVLVLVL